MAVFWISNYMWKKNKSHELYIVIDLISKALDIEGISNLISLLYNKPFLSSNKDSAF